MPGSRGCKTINLAKVSIDCLKSRDKKIGCEKQPPKTAPKLPPPPRVIKSPTIRVCKSKHVEFIHPAVPCLCPPCPICPSRGEQISKALAFVMKGLVFYIIYDMFDRNDVFSEPSSNSQFMTDISNSIADMYTKRDPEDPPTFSPENSAGLLELGAIKEKSISFWNKGVYWLFWGLIGYPTLLYSQTLNSLDEQFAPKDKEIPKEKEPPCVFIEKKEED